MLVGNLMPSYQFLIYHKRKLFIFCALKLFNSGFIAKIALVNQTKLSVFKSWIHKESYDVNYVNAGPLGIQIQEI